LAGFLSLLGL
jgi:hypothetical protein